jgi:hypothetical protein
MQSPWSKDRYSDNATLTREGILRALSPAVTSRQSDTFRIAPQTSTAPQRLRPVALRYVTYKRLCIYRSVSITSCHRQLDIGALPRPAACLALPWLIDRVERETPIGEKEGYSRPS